jgi:hypothetical protein
MMMGTELVKQKPKVALAEDHEMVDARRASPSGSGGTASKSASCCAPEPARSRPQRGCWRPSSDPGTVVLPCDELPEPSQNSARPNNEATLLAFRRSQRLAFRCQTSPLLVGQRDPALARRGSEHLHEHPVLLVQVVEPPGRALVEGVGQHGYQELDGDRKHLVGCRLPLHPRRYKAALPVEIIGESGGDEIVDSTGAGRKASLIDLLAQATALLTQARTRALSTARSTVLICSMSATVISP